jgi:hypothetical protein
MDSVITSACADEQLEGTTRLTPMTTGLPVARSNTPAANGPPVPRSKFRREKRMTSAMRASGVGSVAGSLPFSSMAHCGSDRQNS